MIRKRERERICNNLFIYIDPVFPPSLVAHYLFFSFSLSILVPRVTTAVETARRTKGNSLDLDFVRLQVLRPLLFYLFLRAFLPFSSPSPLFSLLVEPGDGGKRRRVEKFQGEIEIDSRSTPKAIPRLPLRACARVFIPTFSFLPRRLTMIYEPS